LFAIDTSLGLDSKVITTAGGNKKQWVLIAAKALGDSSNRELKKVKKHVLSAAGRAAIARAAKRPWAKVRARAKKVAG
jgi:hypothetical protein